MTNHRTRTPWPTIEHRGETLALAGGPVLFAVGLAVTYFIADIGPLDRAKVQGFVGLPLMAVAPGIAGLAGRTPEGRSRARVVTGATALGTAIVASWTTAVSVTFVGCRPVTSPIDVLPAAVIVGLLAAVTYGVAGTAALGTAGRRPGWAAVAVGALSFVGLAAASLLVVLAALFPPLSCAAPR
jgi:hypothetical protein